MTTRHRLLAIGLAVGLLTAPVGADAQLFGSRAPTAAADSEKGVLASLISRALSTPAQRVSIGGVEGALSSEAVIRNIEISDRDGVWLRLDSARIVWRRLALLTKRLEIDRLEIGTLDIVRKPIPAETAVAGEDQPLLPELPVKVEIKAFELKELKLGEPILGTPARIGATGNAQLSNDLSEGLALVFDARRLDQPGTLAARLTLVPQGQRLTLGLNVDEPAGGLAARLANIPGLPPVKLGINGQGSLDAFGAQIALDAGPDVGAQGRADLARRGTARQLTLDLQAKVAGLLPPAAGPIFAGDTRLTGNAAFADDGTMTLPSISLVAAAARLDASGSVKDGQTDFTLTAANVPNRDGRTVTGDVQIRRLALQGRLTGPYASPNIAATLHVEDASLPDGRLGKLEATFTAADAGKNADGISQLRIQGDGTASGIAPRDAGLARAIGGSAKLVLRGTANTKRVAQVDTLEVSTPTVAATYSGLLGSGEMRGALGLQAASLRPFAGIASLPGLAGALKVTADLEGTPRANRYNATLDGQIASFATGISAVDGLFGGQVGLKGGAGLQPDGTYGFQNLVLSGASATATLNGSLGQESADLGLVARLPDLAKADGRLTGHADLTARVTGGLQHPNLVANAALADATALGRSIPRLALDVDVKDATGAVDGTVKLDGTVDGKPARGGFAVRRPAAGGYALDGLDLAIGSVGLKGALGLDPANLASGRVTLNAGNIADLSGLLLTEAAGSVNADVSLDAAGGRQNAHVVANGSGIQAYGASLDRLAADLQASDLYGRPAVSGQAQIDTLKVAGEDVSQIRLDAKPAPAGSDVTLTAQARGFDLAAAARLVPGDRTRVELSKLDARRNGQAIRLGGTANVTVVPGGADIAGLVLAIGNGRARIDGRVGQDMDLRLVSERLPLSVADLAREGLGLGGQVDGQAHITGSTAQPTGDFRFRASGVTAPQTRAARMPTIDATLVGKLTGDAVALDGSMVEFGRSALRITGSAPLSGASDLALAIKGQLDPSAANGFVGSSLRLSGQLDTDLAITGTTNRPEARIDLRGERFAAGQALLDGLLGPRPTITGRVFVPPAGGFAVDNLKVDGAAMSARIDGAVTPDKADLDLTAAVPDLHRADARLTGRADVTGKVTGTLDHPDATARVALSNASALGRPIPRLALDAVARDLTGALDARVTLDGEIDRRPARGNLHLARPAAGGYALDGLDVQIGSAKASGSVTLDPDNLARGRLLVNAPNLDDLSPLLLTRAAGTVNLDASFDVADGGQNARIKAGAERVAVSGVTVSKADADLQATDLYRRPAVTGQARIDEAKVAGETLSRIRLTAQPAPGVRGAAAGSDLTLTGNARGFDLDARARLVPGDQTRIEISQLAASQGSRRIALAGPATVTLVPGGADLKGVAIGFGTGRLTLDGTVGSSKLDLRAEARAVPLSAADLVSPGLGLAGTLNGRADIAGTPSAPSGAYNVKIDGLQSSQTRGAGLPPVAITADGRLDAGRATLQALLAAGRVGQIRVNGSLPAGGQGNLDLTIKGNLDAGAATVGILAPAGRRLTGRLDVDAHVGGTLSAPDANGAATLSGGTFTDALQGTQLSGIRARIVARGQEVTIENVGATARNGGSLGASGRVRLDPGAGFPGDIRLRGQNAELVRSGLVTAVVNLNMALTGPLARDPRVSGRIDLVSADVTVPTNLSGALKPLPNTRHVRPTRTAAARLALDKKKTGAGAAPAFDAILDLTLNAPGRIYVRGHGLDAELGGTLRVAGTLAKPVPNGAFELRRGSLTILTSTLDFSRGRVVFTGDLTTPELDFQANTNAGGAAIQIAVTGPADKPSFAFTSTPDLPQDEVLSRLLFNSPAGQLSAFQAISLAQTAAEFSSGGDGAFENLRKSLGLSGVDIGLGSAGGLTGGLQRRLGDRVSVGIKAGAGASDTGVGIDYRITDTIRLQGNVGATGGANVGVSTQYEW